MRKIVAKYEVNSESGKYANINTSLALFYEQNQEIRMKLIERKSLTAFIGFKF